MPFVRSNKNGSAAMDDCRWRHRLCRAVWVVCSVGLLLAPASGFAAGASMDAVGNSNDPTVLLVKATAISDTEMAGQAAKGLAGPVPAMQQNMQQPRVILWDEIGQPATSSSIDNQSSIVTITVGH